MSVGSRGARPGGLTFQRASIVACVDVGTSKICCLVAETFPPRGSRAAQPAAGMRIIGAGYHAARGVRGGAVVDMDAAEAAIRMAVDEAERQAGVTLERVFVSVSGGSPRNERFYASINIAGRAVEARDADQLFHLARAAAVSRGRAVVHAAPVEYQLDGHRGIVNPLGMYGEAMGNWVNVVSVAPGPMRNLALCIERCHLDISGLVIAPFAGGLSTLVDDERKLGACCVEMGAGTTGLAMFLDDRLVHAEMIPLGGQHITNDIARGLSTTITHGERLKTLFGSALPSIADDRDLVAVPLVGEAGTDAINKVPRSMLTGIIQPRLAEILERVGAAIEASGFAATAGRRLVLTGGAAQLTGARELAASLLARNVRSGEPIGIEGLPDICHASCLATAAGMLKFAISAEAGRAMKPGPRPVQLSDTGYLAKVGTWIRQSF